MRKPTVNKSQSRSPSPDGDHEVIARLATRAGDASTSRARELVGSSSTPGMNLYYVVTRENTFAVVAAPDLETAQAIPPYSNWRDLMSFGGWTPEDGQHCKITCIAAPSTLNPNSTPGVLLAGGMGFYSAHENGVKFV